MTTKQQRREDQAEGVRDSYSWLLTKRDMARIVTPALTSGQMGKYSGITINHLREVERLSTPPGLRTLIINDEVSGIIFGERQDPNQIVKWTWPLAKPAKNYSLCRERRAKKRTDRTRGRRWRFDK